MEFNGNTDIIVWIVENFWEIIGVYFLIKLIIAHIILFRSLFYNVEYSTRTMVNILPYTALSYLLLKRIKVAFEEAKEKPVIEEDKNDDWIPYRSFNDWD